MLILNAADVRRSLPMHDAVEAMKKAFAALSDGRAEVPLRTRLPVPSHDALSIFMPAFVAAEDGESLAIKVVSLFPGNPGVGLGYIQAAVLALEPDTGRALGLLEGSSLTAIRTGAAGGAAIDLLARPEARVMALFGAGAQGRTQIEAACTVRKIETVWIFDSDVARAEAVGKELAGTGPIPLDVRVAATPSEAVGQADVICTATTASSPVFSDSELAAGVHISAVGSYTPEMQEIPGETVSRARLFVDSRSAALAETGDLIRPIRAGLFSQEHITAELGELVLGRKEGRRSSEEVTLFKSVGVAAQDAVAASLALRNARRLGLGQEVQF